MYSKVFFFLIFASISCRSIDYLSSREMGCIHTTANTDFNIMGRQITSKFALMSIKFVSLGVSDSVFAEGIIKNPTTLTPVPNVHIIVGHPLFNGNDYSVAFDYEAQSLTMWAILICVARLMLRIVFTLFILITL